MKVVALDQASLSFYLADPAVLYTMMGLKDPKRPVDRALKYVFSEAEKRIGQKPEDLIWWTRWEVISKEDRMSIGEFCFKGPPNQNGAVEVGYGIDDLFQNRGFASELLSTMVDWLFSERSVAIVKAETDWDNLASQAVLKHAGFLHYKTTADSIWWRKRIHTQTTDCLTSDRSGFPVR